MIDPDKLRALNEAATPGPYDTMPGSLIRALRGEVAVPIFESRTVVWDPANEGPTLRGSDGAVLSRKGSRGAKISQGMRREHANVELVAYLLNSVHAILAMAEENGRMREAGTRLAFAAGALNIATDSAEHLRGERGNVLDALKAWKSAVGEEKA